MANESAPVVLELAPLPREQLGPFLILGVEKDADQQQIEANWAQRIIWARKNQLGIPLEDVNWAREVISDMDRRIRADAASLNLDTIEGALRRLAARFGGSQAGGPSWEPLDSEQDLSDYTPAVEWPDPAEVLQAIRVPEPPSDLPAVGWLLEQLCQEPLDPWAVSLPCDSNPDSPVPAGG